MSVIAIARESAVFVTPLPGSDACATAQASTQIHTPITVAFKFILILLITNSFYIRTEYAADGLKVAEAVDFLRIARIVVQADERMREIGNPQFTLRRVKYLPCHAQFTPSANENAKSALLR
jgi:hypothetical protein